MIWDKEILFESGAKGARQCPQLRVAKANAVTSYLLGFFVAGGFFSPPLVLISAKKSLALNG